MPNSDYVCGQRRPRANHNQTFNRARRLPHSQQFSNCCVHHTAPHRECGGRQNLFGAVPRAMTTSLSLENRRKFCPKQKILKYFWLWNVEVAWNLLSFHLDYIYYTYTYMFYSNKLVMHMDVCMC